MRFVQNLRFFCVNDAVALPTIASLETACRARGIEFLDVDARSFDYAPERKLRAGDLMYRPGVSQVAMRVEQFLWNSGVVTFHARPDGVFFVPHTPPLCFEHAGLPIPRTVYCSTTNRKRIEQYVAHVGGFPLIVKMLGHANGIGVMRVDSFPALYSLLDYELSQGANPLLAQYIADAAHWRLIVLGERVIASYRKSPIANDFRAQAVRGETHSEIPPDAAMQKVAVAAAHVLGYEFAGVDILEQADGQFFLLEANFPCYYVHAQEYGDVDVAGMMLDFLAAKATRES